MWSATSQQKAGFRAGGGGTTLLAAGGERVPRAEGGEGGRRGMRELSFLLLALHGLRAVPELCDTRAQQTSACCAMEGAATKVGNKGGYFQSVYFTAW